MSNKRKECEDLIYSIIDKLDPTGKNKEYWMEKFAKMDDKQFDKCIANFPYLFFQTGVFDSETTIPDVKYMLNKSLKQLGVDKVAKEGLDK